MKHVKLIFNCFWLSKTSTFMWLNLILSLKGKTKFTTLPVLGEPMLILDDCHKMLKNYCLAIFF